MANLQKVDSIPDEIDENIITDDQADFISSLAIKGHTFKPRVVQRLLYTRKKLVDALESEEGFNDFRDELLKQLKGDLT